MSPDSPVLLAVGAGEEQAPAIVKARSLGCRVVAADGNRDAPGLRLADLGVHLDLRDTAAVIALARQHAVRALVPAPLGPILRSAAAVTDALGLPGPGGEAARLSTDKFAQRQALSTTAVAQPDFLRLAASTPLPQVLETLPLPLVLKPAEGSGSRGVRLLQSQESLAALFDGQQRLLRRYVGYLLESRLPGEEFGVDAVAEGGQCRVLALRAKTLSQAPHRVALRYDIVVDPAPGVRAAVDTAAREVAAALHYRDCLFHMDITVDQGGQVHLIESAARPAGYGIVSTLLPAVLGMDPTEQMLARLLGRPCSFEHEGRSFGMVDRLVDPPGTLLRIGDVDRARRLPGVLDLRLGVKVGDYVAPYESGADCWRTGQLTLAAPTRDELNRRRAAVGEVLGMVIE